MSCLMIRTFEETKFIAFNDGKVFSAPIANLKEIRGQAFCDIPARSVNFLKGWSSLKTRGKV